MVKTARSRFIVLGLAAFLFALCAAYTVFTQVAMAQPCSCGTCMKYCCVTEDFEPAKLIGGNCTGNCNFTLDCPCGPCP